MKIDEMLEKYCKNGVRFYKLDEIVDFLNGKGHEKNIVENGRYIVVNSKFISTDGDTQKFSNEQICPVYKDDILMVMSDLPNGRALAKCFYIEDDDKYTLNQRICALRVKDKDLINIRFLYYYLNRNRQLLRYDNGVDQTNLRKDDILNIRVAVPPLEVQCEIVHILDDFTLLSAELSAELKARQKQFNYYRSKLFEKYLSDFVELDSIGDVTKLAGFEFTKYVKYSQEGNIIALRGLNVKDGRLVLNDIKYIDNSDFSKLERSKLYKNDLLYTYVGTVGQVGLVDQNNKYYLAPNVARIRINNSKVLPKFVMYFLQTPEFKVNQLDKLTGASSMKNITMTNIRKFKIPLPSIEEQERIVNILDRFDKYCNNISEGLPAEIEARQKQYEYYRDKLLTFKELKVNE